MKALSHILYWVIIMVVFTIIFGNKWDNYPLTFYFFSLLLPIAIGTSYFFNYYLVPNYLLTRKYFYFGLYTCYTIIASLYFEMLAILFAFVVISNYQIRILDPVSSEIFILEMVIYFMVLLQSVYLFTRRYHHKEAEIIELSQEWDRKERQVIQVTADRKQQQVSLDQLLFIESLSDYVKLVCTDRQIITRERISHFEQQLPDNFLRIHRSFIVNTDHISSFSKESVDLGVHKIPISRKYKNKTLTELTAS